MTQYKYTEEQVRLAVSQSKSFSGVLRYLGIPITGGNSYNIKNRILSHQIDISHFTGQAWNRGGAAINRRPTDEVLTIWPKGSRRPNAKMLRRSMLEKEVKYTCAICGLQNIWNGKLIGLEIDHISGDWLDNRLENLRFLCPNCHSQQDTNRFRGKKSA